MAQEDREQFWALWRSVESQMPATFKRDIQAAQHGAWLMYQAMKQQQQTPTPPTPQTNETH